MKPEANGGTERRCGGVFRILIRSAIPVFVLLVAAAPITASLLQTYLGPLDLAATRVDSVIVLDRKDRLLRAFTAPDGRWRLPVKADDVDARYLTMLFAYEDRRFWQHPGVDILAFGRSAWLFLRHGRVVSGGSTITMQVVRLIGRRHERTVWGKLKQIAHALELEQRLSKTEILQLYLRLAPFGGNLEGVRAATLAYLGKEPRRLSLGEAALLVALPQSPEARRPDRRPGTARNARGRVLARMVKAGVISQGQAERANGEPVPKRRRAFPMLAPHLADAEVAADVSRRMHKLTLDRNIQASLEVLAAEHARRLGARLSTAMLVVDHRRGDVIAYVGSAGYLDERRFGAVDMVKAVRSPGSTLKPFIYGLAFESGLAHPAMLIEDRPVRFGTYAPKNFDDEFHGTVSVREALTRSLNIPAVKLLNVVGPGRLVGRLRNAGASPVLSRHEAPTLAVGLGGIGLKLSDLALLYASLARGGAPIRLRHRVRSAAVQAQALKQPARARLLDRVAAWYVSDILKGVPPPVNARGGQIAFKTGTSYGFRDAWAAGFDGRYAIVAWAGRPDGAATPGLTGASAAAPLLFDAFGRLSQTRVALPPAPAAALRVGGALLPPPLRRFAGDRDHFSTGPFLKPAVRIAFPPDRAELVVDAEADGAPVVLRAQGGVLPLTWLVDGRRIDGNSRRRTVNWQPADKGFVRVSVIDALGRTDRVTIRLR